MGRPFEEELQSLPATYTWAMAQPIEALVRAVERLFEAPLLAVGSGGSFSVCHFARHLHEAYVHQPALALTPLQAVDLRTPSSQMSVLIPTAGGSNPDVVAATRLLAEQEPRSVLVVCGDPGSRVAKLCRGYELIDFVPFVLPAGKDGFLATNSLLAFCVLLTRAYENVAGRQSMLPKDLSSLLGTARCRKRTSAIDEEYRDLLARETLIVLHGPSTSSAAIDIESKFTEAALGAVQVADFRQFAHGRHHWIAKNPDTSAVLSIEAKNDVEIASQTVSLLPSNVPVKRLFLQKSGPIADLAGIVEGFRLAGAAGRFRHIDPGRPGVPSFGRKLYHTNAFRKLRSDQDIPAWKVRAIERKAACSVEQLKVEKRLAFWLESLDRVVRQLADARFPGIVVDYDGTLCHEDRRTDALPNDIVQLLTRLLAGGVSLGVATGRGKSVRARLREAFPNKYWSRIVVGYYNGGELLNLNDSRLPNGEESVGTELIRTVEALKEDGLLKLSKITLRSRQVTLSELSGLSLPRVCENVEAIVNNVAPKTLRVMRSGHSVDIVPQSVSKLAVVERILEETGNKDAPILRIGDRGRWPGNDGQLLASPYGLSVYEVSSESSGCWNLSPSGYRGHQATIQYLKRLSANKNQMRFQANAFTGCAK